MGVGSKGGNSLSTQTPRAECRQSAKCETASSIAPTGAPRAGAWHLVVERIRSGSGGRIVIDRRRNE